MYVYAHIRMCIGLRWEGWKLLDAKKLWWRLWHLFSGVRWVSLLFSSCIINFMTLIYKNFLHSFVCFWCTLIHFSRVYPLFNDFMAYKYIQIWIEISVWNAFLNCISEATARNLIKQFNLNNCSNVGSIYLFQWHTAVISC